MAYCHVAHDCFIGDNCIFSNNSTLAGHVTIGDNVVLAGMVAVHQFVSIGNHAFVTGGSLVRKDVPPFVKAAREPLSYVGINSIGLRRRGFSREQIHHIQDVYRELFVRNRNVNKAVAKIQNALPDSSEKDAILSFVRSSERGLVRGFRSVKGNVE